MEMLAKCKKVVLQIAQILAKNSQNLANLQVAKLQLKQVR